MAKVADCPGFETFGRDAKNARKAKGMSRQALADLLHIDSRYLANIENEGEILGKVFFGGKEYPISLFSGEVAFFSEEEQHYRNALCRFTYNECAYRGYGHQKLLVEKVASEYTLHRADKYRESGYEKRTNKQNE